MVLALVPCVHMRNPLLPCQNMIFNPTSSWVELHKKEKYCRTLSHNDLVCYASIIPDISSLMFIWFMGGKYWTMEVSLIAPFFFLSGGVLIVAFHTFWKSTMSCGTCSQRGQFQVWKRSHRFIRSRLFVRSRRFKDPNSGCFSLLR